MGRNYAKLYLTILNEYIYQCSSWYI